jgi:hypothetical protein
MTAWCTTCWHLLVFSGNLPTQCACGGKKWRPVTMSFTDQPKKPYALSEMDRRFLHSIHVAPQI